MPEDHFCACSVLKPPHGDYNIYRLACLERDETTRLQTLPYSIRTLLESLLVSCCRGEATPEDVTRLAKWTPQATERPSFCFRPSRIVMQDFSGVPTLVDLAALRSTISKMGGDPEKINSTIPVDLVIDHSSQVDFFADPDALRRNTDLEIQRNRERYEFLKWGEKTFNHFRITPPSTGIVHQVNLEYFSQVVLSIEDNGMKLACMDTLVGVDSHTTMVNALGILGWGVGGIEAEAIMLGYPYEIITPDIVGFKLAGRLREGVTATDLTLTIAQMLRDKDVVEKWVEFYGAGLEALSLPDRATVANMAPEFGATMCFFPVDEETLRYLRMTGRPREVLERVECYTREQGLFRTAQSPDPDFSETIELDLSSVEPSLAGPKHPHSRIPLGEVKQAFRTALTNPVSSDGYGLNKADLKRKGIMGTNGGAIEMGHGAVVIAAITSCTNTSNPSLMVTAGLLAKKALERGLKVKPSVKTSLSPGSRVVTEYLQNADLLDSLSRLGFNVVGYGCATCIGNSGSLPGAVVKAITGSDLVAAAILSGSRNFEGRVHPLARANFLASPPLVVAYALVGTMDINLQVDPLGLDPQGNPVYLNEIWPSNQEVEQVIAEVVKPELFIQNYAAVFDENELWNNIRAEEGVLFPWRSDSMYIQRPPFLNDIELALPPISEIRGARVLALLGDSISTDHISPGGIIPIESPAGKYLLEKGVPARDFNTYGSHRGDDRVMIRGVFSNLRLKNRLLPGTEGGITFHQPDGEKMPIYNAAIRYQSEGVPLVIVAGKGYGCGSSRDWAAKGTRLLGVKAVIAESFERIHRANLVGMGVLPLQFMPGENADSLGLDGSEIFDIVGLTEALNPHSILRVHISRLDGASFSFQVMAKIDTPREAEYFRNGGILPTILRNML